MAWENLQNICIFPKEGALLERAGQAHALEKVKVDVSRSDGHILELGGICPIEFSQGNSTPFGHLWCHWDKETLLAHVSMVGTGRSTCSKCVLFDTEAGTRFDSSL
jgi:hypothetical protein